MSVLVPGPSPSVHPRSVLLGYDSDAPPPSESPRAGIVLLVADCVTQLSNGLIVTPATISSPAAVPALPRLISTPDAQLPTLLPTVPVTRFDSFRLFATISLQIVAGSTAPGGASSQPSSGPLAAAPAPAEPPGAARSPSSPRRVSAEPPSI